MGIYRLGVNKARDTDVGSAPLLASLEDYGLEFYCLGIGRLEVYSSRASSVESGPARI